MSQILELCRDLPVRTFEAGTVLLEEGKQSGRLYFLIDGSVEVLKGQFQVDIISTPGAVFGEMSILLGIPHTATVRAMGPSRFYVADNGDALMKSNREIAYDLARLLAQRLQTVTTYLANLDRYVRAI